MKNVVYIFCLLAVLLSGCTGTSRQPQLVAADSLLQTSPDSSLQQLKRMDVPQSRADRMYYYLLLADAANKCYDTLPSDSIMQEVADFYDSHGSANEQVRAHYMLGCVYRDMGEAPQALDCYHDAVECADTTAKDCDFRTLSRVHSQMAALLGEQMLPHEQLEELRLQYSCAMRAKDTLCALNATSQSITTYEVLGTLDSVMIISQRLSCFYEESGHTQKAAIAQGGKIIPLIKKGNYTEAGKIMKIYESKSGLFDKDGNIEKGKEIYYGAKGLYFVGIHQLDSALYYFRKEFSASIDLNNLEATYRGLYLLYKQAGQRDSMSKYAQLAYETTDAHFQEKQTEELRHMQALYNYTRHQSIARQKTAEANRNRMQTVILSFIFIMIAAVGLFTFIIYKRRKQEQIQIMSQRYEHDLEALEQAKYDLMKMQEARITHLIAEKEADISRLKKSLEIYGQSLSPRIQHDLEDCITKSVIYQRLCYLVMHPREKVTQEEWNLLREMMDQTVPLFRSTLYGLSPNLKSSDYDICMLDRLHFSPSEIALLTGYGLSTITMKRIRLLNKLYHLTGKGEQFDVLIRSIR